MRRRPHGQACPGPFYWRRWLAAVVGVVTFAGAPGLGVASAAVPEVRARTAATVTADALPTVQINGVVWVQVMINDVVYAGGEFTAARPAGAAAGTDEISRSNLLAYDIRTGELVQAFAPGTINGAVRALAVSPNKKTLYVGGDFTMFGSVARGHFAAVDPASGALKSSKPAFNNTVTAIAANSKKVYVGGDFTTLNGRSRVRLAAVSASSGKLSGWKATANASVRALLLTKGSKLLVAGGMFTKLNSTLASGSGAMSPTTGKAKTWKINKVAKNGGTASAILSLTTDGSAVYGGGYTYGTGNFEGVYAASAKDGAVRWLQDCHGDTYSVLPVGDVVYSVGHAHYCSNIGGFPDTSDDSKKRSAWYRALAVSKNAAGTVARNGQFSAKTYTNFEGKPAPALLNWFPNLSAGTYTGMSQAAWSIVGNGTYVALGGEFPKVNGVSQQGLVRMVVPKLAPNEVGPSGNAGDLALAASVQADGSVASTWNQLWDRDDLTLTYKLTRDGVVIDSRAMSTAFWQQSPMSFVDTRVARGTTVTYQLTVSDPAGNSVMSSPVSVALPDGPVDDGPGPQPSSSASTVEAKTPAATPAAATRQGTDREAAPSATPVQPATPSSAPTP